MTPLLGEVLEILLAIIERIPLPDMERRKARLLQRLTRSRERLKARVEAHPEDTRAKARLAGVQAALDLLERAYAQA